MSDLPTTLSEMDRLKLALAKERAGRLQADAINLQNAQRQLEAAVAKGQVELKALSDELKERYSLAPGDEVAEDGTIKRAPVRALEQKKGS